MKQLQLVGGGSAQVDDEDYSRLSGFSWRLERSDGKNPTVLARVGRTKIILRRRIINAPDSSRVIHLDGDPLNHCRNNLALKIKGSSMTHLKTKKHPRLGIVGVVWNEDDGIWQIVQTRFGHTAYRGRFFHRDEAIGELDKAISAYDLL